MARHRLLVSLSASRLCPSNATLTPPSANGLHQGAKRHYPTMPPSPRDTDRGASCCVSVSRTSGSSAPA
ncbi:hypothetical protein GQ607_010721 [Colletotrichum asianum]|uniref:Uncharacterized protein n=1 Tax=Colletotrichum asianum TaxID=702518 RepID=A0A8H3W9I7_9PEZI|nr:hypothetical protein GQ607_010721 [Colletotrichum asianum]